MNSKEYFDIGWLKFAIWASGDEQFRLLFNQIFRPNILNFDFMMFVYDEQSFMFNEEVVIFDFVAEYKRLSRRIKFNRHCNIHSLTEYNNIMITKQLIEISYRNEISVVLPNLFFAFDLRCKIKLGNIQPTSFSPVNFLTEKFITSRDKNCV